MLRLQNAWRLAKASWQVLFKDRELVAIPVVAGIVSLLVFLAIGGIGFAVVGGTDGVETGNVALWLFGVAALVAATWVSAIGQAAVVAGAAERMDGGDPTLSSAYAVARTRVARLLEWAALATIVAIVLDQIEERLGVLGQVVSWLGGIAFSVMSFLALPVIVFEDLGAIEAFKRSSRLLKTTWGEQIAFNFGTGLLGFVAALPGIVIGGALLASGLLLLQVLGGIIAVVWIGLVAAVVTTLSAVFKAALYRWATGSAVDPAFTHDDLSNAFRRR